MPGERGRSPSPRGWSTAWSISQALATSSICARVMPPGRNTRGVPPVRSTTVDSTPTWHGPPSRISGTRPSMSSKTSGAVVGLGRPERLALGAAMGTPAASISARATGCEGMRTATVASPAVTRRGTLLALGEDQRQRPRPEGFHQGARLRSGLPGDERHKLLRRRGCVRSADCRPAVPWRRISFPPPKHPARSRPVHRRSRWGSPPPRRRAEVRPRAKAPRAWGKEVPSSLLFLHQRRLFGQRQRRDDLVEVAFQHVV